MSGRFLSGGARSVGLRLLVAAAVLAGCAFVGTWISHVPVVESPVARTETVAILSQDQSEDDRGDLHQRPPLPQAFLISDPRSGAVSAAHLLMCALGIVTAYWGQTRRVTQDMPALPVRRWRGRALGVPLHRGPPALT